MTLNEQLKQLEKTVFALKSKLEYLSLNLEDKAISPYAKIGTGRDNSQNRPVDIGSGLGNTQGGNLTWNDSELKIPPYGVQPNAPTKGYNNHGHSRYSGGAFDIGTLEFVEYVTDVNDNIVDENGNIMNKHTQQFWSSIVSIVQEEKNLEEGGSQLVDKIGTIKDSLVFDTSDNQWKILAVFAEEDA